MKKVLVIGHSGMVASRFMELAANRFQINGIDEHTLDITNEESVNRYFGENDFDTVINFAAYTDVAKAEQEWNNQNGICWRLNVLAPKYLANASKKFHKHLVQFSTDFVFEGLEDSKGPFDEDMSLPNVADNLCWYGWTKNRGEIEVKNTGIDHSMVRIANPFRSVFPLKLDFARKILDLYDKKSLFPLFSDQVITPIFIDELVEPLARIIENSYYGNFHLVSSDAGSYFDVGSYILEKARGVIGVAEQSSLIEFMKTPGRNKRPIFGGLATTKTQDRLGVKFNTWKVMVDNFTKQLGA